MIVSHFVSFQHFSHRSTGHGYGSYSGGRTRYSGGTAFKGGYTHDESFMDVATYFALLVWLVPFYLFLSLSANDNALPLAGESPRVAASAATHSLGASTSHPEKARPPPIQITNSNVDSGGHHQRKPSSILKKSFASALSLVPAALKPGSSRGGMSAQRDGLIGSPVRSHPPSPALGLGFDRFGGTGGSPNLGGGGWVNGGPAAGGPGTPPVGPPPRSPVLGAASAGQGPGFFGGETVQRQDSLRAPGLAVRRKSEDGLGVSLAGEGAGLGFGLGGRDSPSLGARSGWDSPASMSPRLSAVSGFESAQSGGFGAPGLSKRK